jgi:hypothetical protein
VSESNTYDKFVKETVSNEVRLVSTDEAHHYNDLRRMGYRHRTVNHSHDRYVRGDVHTQSIESFWSLLKARDYRQLPQGQQEISAAVSQRVFLLVQQPEQP